MALIRASEIYKPLESSGLLEKRMPISLLDEIAYHLEDWEELAPFIDLTDADQEEIRNDYDRQYLLQKRQALRRWRKKGDLTATLKTFVSILCKQGLISLAEMVVKKSRVPPSCLSIFAKYLQHFYIHDFNHPANNQWPSLLEGFDLPAVYVDLKFHKVPLNETMGVPSKSVEVELRDVFQEKAADRLVILFEGIAGSGKTTLSWHACREWAVKKLLQQFKLLIHVQVNDLRFEKASSLRDLIPDSDKEARDEIAQAITDSKGEGVCVLLEGLDEASKSLRDFVLSRLLRNRDLSRLSVIITSRPDSRLLISLQKYISEKIMLNGFTDEKLHEFLDSAINEDEVGRGKLNKMLELRPRFQALCTLPINAVVVSFLVQCFGHELPVTQTGLFNLLVCHVCIRHIQLRSGSTDLHIERLPYDLPSDLRESFDKLCLIAYTASMEKKRALSLNDLRQADFDNRIGILHISQTKSMYGLSKNYTFPHFALQQFLAAIHLSYQEDAEQISFIQRIVQQDPLDELLPFHAGLANDRIRTTVIETLDCKMSLDDYSVATKLQENPTAANDPRRRTLALCKCFYECQSESLMGKAQLQIQGPPGYPQIDTRYAISFLNMWLSPLECLALGYFVRYKSITLPKRSSLVINLGNCSISDTSACVLAEELRRDIDYHTPGRIVLLLDGNKFNYKTLLAVKKLLKGQSNIEGITLLKSFYFSDKSILLKNLTEGLASDSSCRQLAIGFNGLNQSHVYHLVLMIMSCPQLSALNLTGSSLKVCNCMSLLGQAFSLSKLTSLQLNVCDINDETLAILGEAVSKNPFLELLSILLNPEITPLGLLRFLSFFINQTSSLNYLDIDPDICQNLITNIHGSEIMKQINDIRSQLNREPLEVASSALNPTGKRALRGMGYLKALHSLSRKEKDM